jgi:GNAT superfamily N-acetyltransferase
MSKVTGLILAARARRPATRPPGWPGLRFIVCTIREARLPNDKPAILDFIVALQRYESFLEPNRRIDHAMAEEYFATLLERTARCGNIFIAEDETARPLGWTVVYEEETEAFIRADERRFAYLAELFVVEAGRGTGAAQALIAACEDWAVAHGYTTIRIDLLSRNTRAARAYEKAGYVPYCQEVKKRLVPAADTDDASNVVPLKFVPAKRLPLSAA